MSLIITRNFKRAKAQDAAAKDKAPDGWWEGKTIFAAFGWGKSVTGKVVSHKGGVIKLEDGTTFRERDAYDLYAINSRAGDSVSDKEREYTRLYELAQKNITFYAAKGDSAKVAEWKRKADEYKRLAQEAENAAEARNAKDSRAEDANFKVGDTVRVDASYSRNVNNGIGKVVKVDGSSDIVVEFAGHGTVRIPVSYATLVNSHATDYDPNPQTRGKDIEVFSAQAIREESACENVLRKVIEDVEALVIKIHGPMSSWEEVIENSKMSPELPEAKKWSGTANRRYDYLLARERAISSILSELKRNHID